jgi:hypothetical protein
VSAGDLSEAARLGSHELRAFFRRQKRRAERHVGLAEALLSERGVLHLLQRGSLLFARTPLRVALHLAELVVFASWFEFDLVGWLLVMRSASVWFGALHWGMLEPTRALVRERWARRDRSGAVQEILASIRLACLLCAAPCALLASWLWLGPSPFDGFSILDAYAIGCSMRACCEALARAYHAGAFALRRVHRPLASLLLVDLADAGVALLLWPWLGPWGFALAQLVGGACDALLSVRFSRSTYVELKLAGVTLRSALRRRGSRLLPRLTPALLPGLGNLMSQVDALLIMLLATIGGEASLSLAGALHVLRPALSLSAAWARFFYFDLAQLGKPALVLFRRRLERLLFRAAPLFAALGFALAAGVAALAGWLATPGEWLAGLPLLLVRAYYSVLQVRAFTRENYVALLLGALIVATLLAPLPELAHSGLALLAGISLALLAAAAVFLLAPERMLPPEAAGAPLYAFEWLACVSRHPGALLVFELRLQPGGPRARALAGILARAPSVAAVAILSPKRLLLAQNGLDSCARLIVEASAGSIATCKLLAGGESGRHACVSLLAGDTWGALQPSAEDRLSAHQIDARQLEGVLRREFASRFPAGVVLDSSSGSLSRASASALECARTLREIALLAAGSRVTRRRGLDCAVFAPGGVARVVFFPERGAAHAQFDEFERRVRRASLEASVLARQ